jgi:LDH2 family malate/lactate/ureidoglycolate dehydrogenase
MEAFIAELKSGPLAKGVDEVFYPGELEAGNDVRFRRECLELPQDTVADLRRIAGQLGIAPSRLEECLV